MAISINFSNNQPSMKKELHAILFLLLATLIWGFTFPLIKNAINFVAPSVFVTIRFTLAAIILFPLVFKELKKTSLKVLGAGIILGLLNGGIYFMQTVGVQTISAAQAAFITGTTVILVPFISPVFKVGKTRLLDVTAAILCVIGLFIFTGFAMDFRVGSVWCLLAATCAAVSVVFLQLATKKNFTSPLALTFYQILFTAPIPLIFSLHSNYHNIFTLHAMIGILFCAIFATSIAILLQTKYQHFVNPTKAALIYALEPVFAMLFAWTINQGDITSLMIIGGTVMLLSTLLRIFAKPQHETLKQS